MRSPRSNRPLSVTQRIGLTVGIVVIALSVLSAYFTAVLVTDRVERAASTQALAIAEGFAEQSVFAALVGADDDSVAEMLLQAFLKAPDVLSVELRDTHNRTIKRVGAPLEIDANDVHGLGMAPVVARETDEAWYVLAPVVTKPQGDPLGTTRAPERVGTLAVTFSKKAVHERVRTVMTTGVAVELTLGLIALAIVVWLTRRIMRPMSALTVTMQEARTSGSSNKATVFGAAEFQLVGQVYNELISKLSAQASALEGQAAHLEELVAQRTQQLQTATERAQNAERYKSDLMAIVSHEMKAPLHAIICSVEDTLHELEFFPNGGPSRDFQRQIAREALDLHAKISDILELARSDSERQEVAQNELALPAFLNEIRERILPLARDNRNALHTVHDGLTTISTDKEKLSRIVFNLLSNACKFTHDGRVELRLNASSSRLAISVSDTGRGIDPSIRDLIFEEFRQGSMGEGRAFPGTGLGLAIVRRYVQALGGTIEVTSAVSEGSLFVVSLPLTPVEKIRGSTSSNEAASSVPLPALTR